MARVKARLISVGKYHSPEGEVDVTKSRLEKWSENFRRMKESGLKIPVPWGHSREAKPGNKQFESSKFNAGYLEEVHLSNNGNDLDVVLDVPGAEHDGNKLVTTAELPNGMKVKTAINEVSAGLAKLFRDGQKRVWDDVITHVALVPHPVVHGQEGFKPADSADPNIEHAQSLSLNPEWSLALDNETGKGFDDPSRGDDKKAPKVESDDDDDSGEMKTGYNFKKLLANLKELDIGLPDDTNEKNLCDYLWVASNALISSRNPGGKPPTTPGDRNVVEEQPDQMMLSLLKDNPEALRIYKANQEELASLKREKKKTRLEKAKSRLDSLTLPQEVKAEFFGILQEQNLSLDSANIENDLDSAERFLSLAEKLADSSTGLTRRITNADEQVPPFEASPENNPHLEDMKKSAGVKAAK